MPSTTRRRALEDSNDVFVRQLASAVKSVRRKALPASVRNKLRCHRAALRDLADPHQSLASKRELVCQQKGGFFGAVLASLAAPLVGSILKTLTGR